MNKVKENETSTIKHLLSSTIHGDYAKFDSAVTYNSRRKTMNVMDEFGFPEEQSYLKYKMMTDGMGAIAIDYRQQ